MKGSSSGAVLAALHSGRHGRSPLLPKGLCGHQNAKQHLEAGPAQSAHRDCMLVKFPRNSGISFLRVQLRRDLRHSAAQNHRPSNHGHMRTRGL